MDGVKEEKHFQLEVVKWEGRLHCCYLNNFRIAGGKPWAGGETVKAWSVPLRDVIKAIPELQKMSSDLDAALAREAALREELASLWETVNNTIAKLGIDCVAAQSAPGKPSDVLVAHVDSLKQRLTAAEQRNVTLREALEDLLKGSGSSPGSNKRYAKARAALEASDANS